MHITNRYVTGMLWALLAIAAGASYAREAARVRVDFI
jgi:thiamine transporter ThiT